MLADRLAAIAAGILTVIARCLPTGLAVRVEQLAARILKGSP